MKRKVLSIFIALVLALSLCLVTAVPVAANGTVTNIDTQESFATIQAAIDDTDTIDGHTIVVGAGNWYGATIDKSVEIRGEDGAVIDDGPDRGSWKCGFLLLSEEASGATISHFTFQGRELAIYGWGPDDVTVEHNRIYDTGQGITNWDGDNWVIKHNVIEGIAVYHNGGGIGICVGSRGDDVSGNTITHNRIAAYISGDFTFSVGGILLCNDERNDPLGIVSNNKIVHNKVKITADDSCWAIGLQLIPPRSTEPIGTLRDNLVGFNNLRGSDICIGYYPDAQTLGPPVNTVSRNLGEDANRGHGEVPANIFNPVN